MSVITTTYNADEKAIGSVVSELLALLVPKSHHC